MLQQLLPFISNIIQMPEFQSYPGLQKSVKWGLRIGQQIIEQTWTLCSPEVVDALGKLANGIMLSFCSIYQQDQPPYVLFIR